MVDKLKIIDNLKKTYYFKMDKHIILKLSTLEINEQDGGKQGGTNLVGEKHIDQTQGHHDIAQHTLQKETDPYYEVLWLTGC
jgi:hypothetical protein